MTQRLSTMIHDYEERSRLAECMQFLSCASFGASTRDLATQEFIRRFPEALYTREYAKAQRHTPTPLAAVPPATTTDTPGLLPPTLLSALTNAMQKAAILGRIPGLQKVPANVHIPVLTARPITQWVAQNSPKPCSRLPVSSSPVSLTKCSTIVLIAEEVARLINGGESLMRSILVDAVSRFIDSEFLGAAAAIPDTRPAGVLHAITPVATGATVAATVNAVVGALFNNRAYTMRPTLIVSGGTAAALAGSRVLDDLNTANVSVVVSAGAANNAIALDAAGVFYTDDGVEVDVSNEAAVVADDAPVVNAAAAVTSLWNLNLTGYRVDRFCGWQVAESNAVQYAAVA